MKISAIICEYNPFHNGHKYQIEQIKKSHDAVICVMSGEFVQRGDIAVFDKWTRAKAALLNGADLVVELPVCYALNTAERFSHGAVELIEKMKVVDSLCFGSESGNIDELISASKILNNETEDISKIIKEEIKKGISYPNARSNAFSELINPDLLKLPNNILAIEYLRALDRFNSSILPITVKRHIASHHDKTALYNIASATSIRNLIYSNENYTNFVPENCYELYKNTQKANANVFDNILIYILKTASKDMISNINDVTEGLENKLKDAALHCKTFGEVCEYVKSKRYTYSRIRRILYSIILGITKDFSNLPVEYVRVLGMNECGMNILSQVKEKTDIALITKPADFKNFNSSFDLDIKSGNIYSMCFNDNINSVIDYYNSPVIIKS